MSLYSQPQGSASQPVVQQQSGTMHAMHPQQQMYAAPQGGMMYGQAPSQAMYAPQGGMGYGMGYAAQPSMGTGSMPVMAMGVASANKPGSSSSPQTAMSSVAAPKKKEDRFSFVADVMSQARK